MPGIFHHQWEQPASQPEKCQLMNWLPQLDGEEQMLEILNRNVLRRYNKIMIILTKTNSF